MRFLFPGLLLASALAVPVRALDYIVDDFRSDFSGNSADTAKMDGTFGDTLKIAPRLFQYTAVRPVFLSDSVGVDGQSGSTPNVIAAGRKYFRTAHVAWPDGHVFKPNDDLTYPRADIVIRDIVVDEGRIILSGGSRIAGQENVPDPFTPKLQGDNRSPTYFTFIGERSRYAAYWGSMDPGAYLRHTTSKIAASGGAPDNWGRYVFVTAPNDPVNVAGYGEVSAAVIPGTAGRNTVLAYETNIQVGNYQFEIRREDIENGTYTVQTVTRPAAYAEDFAVAADTSGRVLVLFRENNSLYAVWHDGPASPQVGPLLIDNAVSIGDGVTTHFYRPYAAANIVNGRFIIAYTKAGKVYYRTLNLIDPGGAWNLPVDVPGPAVQLNAGAEVCNFPSITVNQDKVLFAWFKRVAVQQDSLVGAVFDRAGPSINTASRLDMPLTSELISFNSVGAGWYKCCHYLRAPSIAMDSAGSIAVTYDNQFWAKLAMTSRYAVFYDSGTFTSKPVVVSGLPAVLPVDPARDSVEYVGYRVVTKVPPGGTAKTELTLAISKDGSFTDPGSAFQTFPSGFKTVPGSFKYQVVLQANGPDNVTQTKVDSLILKYNVQPRRPVIDSIRIGTASQRAFDTAAAYSVLPRKDTIRLVLSGQDLDNGPPIKFYLFLGNQVVDSAVSSKSSPATYRTVLSLKPPDNMPDPLPLTIRTKDSSGWVSTPLDFRPEFRNRAPAETITVARNRGRDSSGVYRPSGGGVDTLAPAAGQIIVLQAGDTSQARLRLGDLNDDTVSLVLKRNGTVFLNRRVAVKDPLNVPLAADTLPPMVDTIDAEVSDADTTVTFRFLVRPNRMPSLDSLAVASYKAKDSTVRAGPFDRLKGKSDTGLVVPSGLPSTLRAGVSDADKPQGDGVQVKWTVYSKKAGCAAGDLACYDKALEATGDSLKHSFSLPQEYLVVRTTDSTGAFTERRLKLEYPMLDTAGAAGLAAALKALQDTMDFVLGSELTSDTVKGQVASTGNVPLQIFSVSTGKNDRRWLDLKLDWEVPGGRDSLRLGSRTDSNAVPAGDTITVPPGTKLNLTFQVTSDSLRGDSILIDTVILLTNDPGNPMIRIPVRMAYNDLPILRISHRGGAPGPAGGYNDDGLPNLLPVRSQLVFTFSETVRIPNPEQRIIIYSWLDSLKNPSGWRPMPGTFQYRRRALAKGLLVRPKRAAALPAASADSLADTLVFRPEYDRPSDSLKVKPAPGAFIHRDILHILVSNAVVDQAGNALDLRLNKKALTPGVLDTIWQVRVDTGVFRVAATVPAAGATGWNPDDNIKVRFNRKLGLPPPKGADTLTTLSFDKFRGDSNRGVWIRSSARGARRYDFHLMATEDGDSTLVFRSRPKLAAFDTVTVTLSGGLTDLDGLTLDGDLNGFPSRFYNPSDTADTTDSYTFTFHTRDQEFYVFPNPYRHSDSRHREKGTITFKNINSLSGYKNGKEVVLRIHSVNGDLVYSSKTSPRRPASVAWASLDWDLRNSAGDLAGTGVYIYTLMLGDSKVLKKGKVAVVR